MLWKSGQRLLRLDADAAELNYFFQGYRRRFPITNCLNESSYTSVLALVLAPETHSRKTFPAPPFKLAKVVQLENLASAKNFEAFFGKCLMPVRQIMNHAKRAIAETQADGGLVRVHYRP